MVLRTWLKRGLIAVLSLTAAFVAVFEFYPDAVIAPYNRMTVGKPASVTQAIIDENEPEYVDGTSNVCFQQFELDGDYNTEGASVTDINNDGLQDIVTGHYWYEAPTWERHIIREPVEPAIRLMNLSDRLKQHFNPDAMGSIVTKVYPLGFFTFHQDVDLDGWIDTIALDLTNQGIHWFKNPRGEGEWEQYTLFDHSRNESPLYTDLLGLGEKQIITGIANSAFDGGGDLVAISLQSDGTTRSHQIKADDKTENDGAAIFTHGLGVGDINGDGLPDVFHGPGWLDDGADWVEYTAGHWFEQTHSESGERGWIKHVIDPMITASQMHTMDVDEDGLIDIVAGSAHERGLFWFEQMPGNTWKPHVIDDSYTQLHATEKVDIDGDGVDDIVAGKSYLAHFGKLDEDEFGIPVLYWYKKTGSKTGPTFTRHFISDDAGLGRQITVKDINGDGLPDIAAGGRNGLFIFLQYRTAGKVCTS